MSPNFGYGDNDVDLDLRVRHLFAPDRQRMSITDGAWAMWVEGERRVTLMFEDEERDAVTLAYPGLADARTAIEHTWWDVEDEEER